MCNLYSQSRSRDEIRRLFSVEQDLSADLPPQTRIYPNQMASVIRLDDDGARIIQQMRWGFPPPPMGSRPVTNVRNTSSTFWRSWLKPAYRCLVPATSFCEYSSDQPKVPHWFALTPERPPFAFAGIWRPWTGVRGKEAPCTTNPPIHRGPRRFSLGRQFHQLTCPNIPHCYQSRDDDPAMSGEVVTVSAMDFFDQPVRAQQRQPARHRGGMAALLRL
jgi:hypothetical protein